LSIGKPAVEVNDLEQAQGRVYEMCRRLVEVSPLLRRETKVTTDRIVFTATGATITALAANYASAAGGHPTISVFDELWGYTSERSRRLWDELVPVPTRKISCRLVVSHAGFENESELLHELYRRGLQQPKIGTDLYAGDGMLMFWSHVPIAPWQDEAWLTDMRRTLRPHQFQRMIENRFVTSESSFIDMSRWDACVDPDHSRRISDRALAVYVGVDAAVKHDASAVVAVTWDQQAQKVRLVQHRIFQPTAGMPLDLTDTIEDTLLHLRSRFNLQTVLYDPHQMTAMAQRLARAGLPMEEVPQTASSLTAASQNLYELIAGGNLVVYRDDALRLAISRTVAVETPRGWKISKEKASHRIDVVVALAMAAHAAVRSPEQGGFWAPSAFLINDAPAPWPTRAGMIFAVTIAQKSEAAVAYFAQSFTGPLLLLDCHIGRLCPALFSEIVIRLDELVQATNAGFGAVVFTTRTLAAEFSRLGYYNGIQEIDAFMAELDDGMLELRAAPHLAAERLKICSEAFLKFHPAQLFDPTVRDDNPSLKIAGLLGVLLALDQERPPPVMPPRRSPNANLSNANLSNWSTGVAETLAHVEAKQQQRAARVERADKYKKFYASRAWRAARYRFMASQPKPLRCAACGATAKQVRLACDHVIPLKSEEGWQKRLTGPFKCFVRAATDAPPT
jgi:hypothetical protein